MAPEEPYDGSDRPQAATRVPQAEPRLRLEFHSAELAQPFRDRFDEDFTIMVEAIVQLEDGTHLQYWRVANAPARQLIETIGEFPTTLDARLLSTHDGTHRIEVHGSARSLYSAFHAFDGETRTATYTEDGVRIVAEFPSGVDVDAVADTVREIYPDLTPVASNEVWTESVIRRRIEDQLTDRQLTALRIAHFGGYYEQPRQSIGEDLADRMGISRQAFHEHLRKGYRVVFTELFDSADGLVGVDS